MALEPSISAYSCGSIGCQNHTRGCDYSWRNAIIRGQDLTASMSRYLIDRIEADARITVGANTRIASLEGDRTLASLRVTTAGGDVTLPCNALFSFIGADPASDWLSGCAALD